MVTKIIKDEPHYLDVLVTRLKPPYRGSGVPGLVINYEIYKSSDNSLIGSGQLNDIGEGVYQKQIILSDLGQYRIIYKTPENFEDGIETLIVVEEIISNLHGINTKLNRILGLTQENFKIYDTNYIGERLVNGKIKIYPSAIDLENDTNEIAIYEINATYNPDGTCKEYKVEKI